MKTKEITLCGQKVMVAYCFATEGKFYRKVGTNIESADFSDPDQTKAAILAGVETYYKGQEPEQDSPINGKDIEYKSKPNELVEALKAVLTTRAEWYEIPLGDNLDEKTAEDSGEEKNA